MNFNINRDDKGFIFRSGGLKKKAKESYSSFWMGDNWNNTSSIFDDEETKPTKDLIALSSYRRAVANFVNIVTGKQIPVTFKTTGTSCTDGKSVIISSKLDDKLFDSAVGLALHEGSHIVLSDFNFWSNLDINIPVEYYDRGFTKGYSKVEVINQIKSLTNWVEDRRIDYYIFKNSPGYKGYYHSMYEKYFNSSVIDKALQSNEYTDVNWDSYSFRVINLTNTNTDLNSLPGLMDIWKVVDLKNISRLNSSEEAFKVALEIYNIVLNSIPEGKQNTDEETGEVSYDRADGSGNSEDKDESSEPRELTDEEFDSLLDSIENGETPEDSSDSDSSDSDSSSSDSDSSSSTPTSSDSDSSEIKDSTEDSTETEKVTLSENQKKQLENAIKKQEKFLNGDIQKNNVTKKEKTDLDAIENSGMTYREVGKDYNPDWGYGSKSTQCIVVNKFNQQLIDSNTVNMVSKYNGERYHSEYGSKTYIEDGIRLGTMLGRKLQVRGETRETKYTRKMNGRIDKRLLAECGFGSENVFSQSFIDSYNDGFLHISVDASGSMSGDKWDKTMTSVVAITKAIDMIQNVDVVVSFRSTQDVGHSYRSSTSKPIILVAYDSRVDSFSKVKNLFKYINVAGTTPEGLTFEAIMDDLIPSSRDRDSYFLNFSDGMPMFSNNEINYNGSGAVDHTKKMVDEMRIRGIKVLSYFVSGRYDSDYSDGNRTSNDFNRMYGTDAKYINVTSVMEVAKTMNKKFLEKN